MTKKEKLRKRRASYGFSCSWRVFGSLEFHCLFCSVYTYESLSNELWVVMRTDETVSMSGYFALWEALPVEKCENKTFRGTNSGYLESPGFPSEESSRFQQPLDCWTFIQAPSKLREHCHSVFSIYCSIFVPVDHRVVLSLETLDFFPLSSQNIMLSQSESAECSSSSSFIAFVVGPNDVLCLDLDIQEHSSLENKGRLKKSPQTFRRSIGDLLEKTKYSLVANSTNYYEASTSSSYDITELVSSANKLAVRFFAKQGKLPGRGFRAKFKIGNSQLTLLNEFDFQVCASCHVKNSPLLNWFWESWLRSFFANMCRKFSIHPFRRRAQCQPRCGVCQRQSSPVDAWKLKVSDDDDSAIWS